MKTLLVAAVLAAAAPAGLAAQTPTAPVVQASATPAPATAAAEAEPGAPASDGGMTIVYFRCDQGRAFTAFELGRNASLSTASGKRYDLKRQRDGYAADGVTYRRTGGRAELNGAAGGPFSNCKRG
jgi:hypothetical protein